MRLLGFLLSWTCHIIFHAVVWRKKSVDFLVVVILFHTVSKWAEFTNMQLLDEAFVYEGPGSEALFRPKHVWQQPEWPLCTFWRHPAFSGAPINFEQNSEKCQGWAGCLGCSGLRAERVNNTHTHTHTHTPLYVSNSDGWSLVSSWQITP